MPSLRAVVASSALHLALAAGGCCAGGGDGSGVTRVRFTAPLTAGARPTPVDGVLAQDTARGLVTFQYGGPLPVAGPSSEYGLLVTSRADDACRVAWWNVTGCTVMDFPFSWRENEAPHCAGAGHSLNESRGVARDGGAGLSLWANALGEEFSYSAACYPVAGVMIFDGDFTDISTARFTGGVIVDHVLGAPPADRFEAPARCVPPAR